MSNQRSREGETGLAIPLMILAFLLVVGFLWWLGRGPAEPEATVPEEVPVAAPPAPAVPEVTVDQLRSSAGQFEGQRVRVSNVGVATAVGSQAFFLDVTQAPFLVKLDSSLVAAGQTVPTGIVTVEGSMLAMSDSIIRDWLAKNIITADQQPVVEFALHFIEANAVRQSSVPTPD